MPFNNMLKSLRLKKGLTQEELAKLTGLTRCMNLGIANPNMKY